MYFTQFSDDVLSHDVHDITVVGTLAYIFYLN